MQKGEKGQKKAIRAKRANGATRGNKGHQRATRCNQWQPGATRDKGTKMARMKKKNKVRKATRHKLTKVWVRCNLNEKGDGYRA